MPDSGPASAALDKGGGKDAALADMEVQSEVMLAHPASGGSESTDKAAAAEDHLPEKKFPTEEIPTKKITWERARMLATTRRARISGFAVGGFVSALPGAVQSVWDYYNIKPQIMPTGGHLVEIGIAIVFGTLMIASLFQFGQPTSADVLAKTFPEMVEQEHFVRRIRRWWLKIKNDFNAPV